LPESLAHKLNLDEQGIILRSRERPGHAENPQPPSASVKIKYILSRELSYFLTAPPSYIKVKKLVSAGVSLQEPITREGASN